MVQDLTGCQDDHAQKDLEERPRGSGQDAPANRCPFEKELLGRLDFFSFKFTISDEIVIFLGRRSSWITLNTDGAPIASKSHTHP